MILKTAIQCLLKTIADALIEKNPIRSRIVRSERTASKNRLIANRLRSWCFMGVGAVRRWCKPFSVVYVAIIQRWPGKNCSIHAFVALLASTGESPIDIIIPSSVSTFAQMGGLMKRLIARTSCQYGTRGDRVGTGSRHAGEANHQGH